MEKAQIELWVLDAKRGDENAFTQLCHHFHASLLRFSFKLSGNEQLAHDAVQNSWLKITKSITRIEDPRAFKSWLYQAVRWQTLDLMRQNKRKESWQLTEGTGKSIDDLSASNDAFAENHDNDNLLKIIATLADIDKQAIHLFYLEEMTLQEISIVLMVPIGTIKSRLNRARKKLKDKLFQEFTQE
jgi:RNA polymerase sigma factor (sigma-70 family)